MAAKATPRRGEPGFAKYAREHGGDPRLRPAPEPQEAPGQPAEPVPQREPRRATSARPGAARSQRQAVFEPGTRPLVSFQRWSVNDASGFVLGALGWVLALQYLGGGTTGVRNWVRAKFINKGAKGEDLP